MRTGCGSGAQKRRWSILMCIVLFGLAAQARGQSSLEINKAIKNGLTEVPSGQTFTYILQYRAASTTTDFRGVVVTDVIDPRLDYVSTIGTVHTQTITYDPGTRALTVTFIDPLPAGSTGEIEVNVRFPSGVTEDGTIASNTASMTSTDPALSATSNEVTIEATAANKAFADKQLLGPGIPLGAPVTYSVAVRNPSDGATGGLNLQNVTMVDQLPAGAVFLSASGGGLYDPGTHSVSWSLGTLTAGNNTQITRYVTVQFNAPPFSLGQQVTNAITVYGTPVGEPPVELEDSVTNTIVAPTVATVFSKAVNSAYVYVGKPISKTYTFTLRDTGNVSIPDAVVTDAIPIEIDVTRIDTGYFNGPAPLASPISVYYQTNLNGAWTGAPGNPYDGGANSQITKASLGLSPGEYITNIMWDFGEIPPNYQISDLRFVADILTTTYHNGDPAEDGDVVTNVADLDYTNPLTGLPVNTESSASITVRSPRPVVRLSKAMTNSNPVNDGATITFRLTLENRTEAALPLTDPVLADLLAPFLTYVPGSQVVHATSGGAPAPTGFAELPNYNGTGRTLVRWTWAPGAALPVNSWVEIRFQATLAPGTLYGAKTNDVVLASHSNSPVPDTYDTSSYPDSNDLDGDGNITEPVFYRRFTYNIAAMAAMDSVKWVKGELDADWHKYPESGLTVQGGQADYRLIVKNTGNVPMANIRVIDILPFIGDTGVIDLGPRNTIWRPNLVGPVVPADPSITVYYSTEGDPTRTEMVPSGPPGSSPPNWSTTPPADITEVQSLRFDFGAIVLAPQQEIELTWPMRAPFGAPTNGEIAWNSFGYVARRTDTGTELLPSEPIKVGIALRPNPKAEYGNFVWYDADDDGVQDSGEPGVNGIRVELYRDLDGVQDPATDTLVGFTYTGLDFPGNPGFYLFPNLDPGDYYALFTVPAPYTIAAPDQGGDDALDSDVTPITGFTLITTLAPLESDLSWDMGLQLPPIGVAIVKTAGTAPDGGVFWSEPGAPVLYTYVITNTGQLPLGDIVVTDDQLGAVAYLPGPLAPGAQAIVTKTAPSVSDDVVNVGSVDALPLTPAGEEFPGAPRVTDDDPAIVRVYAWIGDRVWYDWNRNGVQDGGAETGVPNVTVRLLDGTGALIDTRATNASGYYLFTSLVPGDYEIQFDLATIPAGHFVTLQGAPGSSDPTDSDADPNTGRTEVTSLASGEIDRTWDMGIWWPASIGDVVWYDWNRDGQQGGAGETGVPGITVNLLDSGGSQVATTTTDGSGAYLFPMLVPGAYEIEFDLSTLPPEFLVTLQGTAGASDPTDSDAHPATGRTELTVLVPGEYDPTWDMGIWRMARIGDQVWYDWNHNGIQDGGSESGVPGVTVNLLDAGGAVVGTQVTDGNGFYLFSSLMPGDYEIEFDLSTLPAGFLATIRGPAGASDPLDSDADPATGRTELTSLAPSEDDRSWDLGIWSPALIGDRVWYDWNRNGQQDGGSETGVPNIGVRLLGPTGAVIATTTTDANGYYEFPGLIPGSYEVQFDLSTLPPGFLVTTRGPIGTSDPDDSDASPADGRTELTLIEPAEIDRSWDMGIWLPASLGDRVWYDWDTDGIQDAGFEGGVAGVTVRLHDAVGAPVATDVTDANGYYLFELLPPGGYRVAFDLTTLPAGYGPTIQGPVSASDPLDSDPEPATGLTEQTTLTPGEDDMTWDLGIVSIRFDLGDAPDPAYPTFLASAGAAHRIVPFLRLGATVDDEQDGQPSQGADGDDLLDRQDDEDGVSPIDLVLTEGAAPHITVAVVNASGRPAYVTGWIDFDRDGVWEPSESATGVAAPGATSVALSFPPVPPPAGPGCTSRQWLYVLDGARRLLRYDLETGTATVCATDLVGAFDLAADEDGNVYIADFGAATVYKVRYGCGPKTALTKLSRGGPAMPWAITYNDGYLYVSDRATGRILEVDPETGDYAVFINNAIDVVALAFDPTGNLYVASHNGAYLAKYGPGGVLIDGRWVDPTLGYVDISDVIVSPTTYQTYARFRISTDAGAVAEPTGLARDGEVEDYSVIVVRDLDYVYFSGNDANIVYACDPFGECVPIADFWGDGLQNPFGLALECAGRLFVGNSGRASIVAIDPATGHSTLWDDFLGELLPMAGPYGLLITDKR